MINRKNQLKRHLNIFDVFCIASGAMISSGLFVLPGIIFAKIGPSVILVYILAGIFFLPALFAKAELSTAMPRAGGSYFFIERSMGSTFGTIGGFASWFSLTLKSAFALIGIGAFATLINPNFTLGHIKLIAIICCIFFTILNILSVKSTSKVQNFLVTILIGILVIYIFKGFMSIDVKRYTPFLPKDRQTLFLAIGMVFISFGGLTKVASIAEEIKNPGKNIPFGMIFSYLAIIFIYGLTIFVTVGILNPEEFANSLTCISNGGHKVFGRFGIIIMSLAAILAFISTANAGILSASRFPVAMSRDELLPKFLSKINKKYNTPHFSIICTGLFMILSISFLNLENLIKVASTFKILLFTLILLACIIMRESKILNYKPVFKSPLYPWIHIIGIISYSFFLYKMGTTVLLTSGIFIIGSVLWYKIYSREKNVRKSALIHIVETIIDKKIAGDSLGKELREILKERDKIIEDRFDKLVRQCTIIDLPQETNYIEFFKIVSSKLSQTLNIDNKKLLDAFIKRENESTTELRPGLAIPHITIPGENKFELFLARCEAGIDFNNDFEPVYAVFILVGSMDERNFHLRALSAIAQITEESNFDKDWLVAKNTEELRDIVLLAKRRRN